MKMTYEETIDKLTEQLIENVSSGKKIQNKISSSSLTKSETLFNAIYQICNHLYQNKYAPPEVVTKLINFKVQRLKNGWFLVDNDFVHGKFINANAVFKYVYCQSEKCHESAYQFMLDYKLDKMQLKSGTIRPYEIGEGILHSIVTFSKENKEYVFDGAYYLLMEKELYNSLFHFTETQSLSRKVIMDDRIRLAQGEIHTKGFIKSLENYRLTTNLNNLSKRFSGMGFVVYLFNRDAFINKKTTLDIFEKENKQALHNLNKKIMEIERDRSYMF